MAVHFSVIIILIFIAFVHCQQSNNQIENQFKWFGDKEDAWSWGSSEKDEKKQESDRAERDEELSNLKREKKCGTTPALQNLGRIFGGREAYIGEFPWQVAIRRKVRSDYVFQCGGAIISDRWIVTAAHCIKPKNKVSILPSDLKIAVATHRLSEVEPENEYTVDRMFTHHDYQVGEGGEFINDIALIRLQKRIDFSSDFVNQVCLPKRDEIFVKNVQVAGWGQTNENSDKSDVLRTVSVFVHGNDECKRNLGQFFHPKEMFCAGVRKGGKDSCAGDAGGAIVKRRRGQAILAGIVSFGIGCGRKGYSGIYTRAPTYLDWITSTIEYDQ